MAAEAFIGLLLVDLHFPDNHSLKGKRSPMASLRDVVQQRFKASFSEVSHQDTWQRARVLVVLAASSAGQAQERIDEIDRYLHAQEYEVAWVVRKSVDAVEVEWDTAF
ncbi:MAG TPA: DUF503 domain-containing protein [Thermoleophilia bacterium]|nr:DUF503 domain-containing protein [Thermoleophilia bacterium]